MMAYHDYIYHFVTAILMDIQLNMAFFPRLFSIVFYGIR